MPQRKLALYSDQNGNSRLDERVMHLIGCASPAIGYIASSPDPERVYFEDRRAFYQKLGARLTVYVDSEMEGTHRAWVDLFQCDAIHLSGGNTFIFLHWLKTRGVLPKLSHYAETGGVLIGVSAGAILLTPHVQAAELCGDARSTYLDDDNAMNLVDFHFWPHFNAAPVSLEQKRLSASLPNLYCCSDGAGIVVDGTKVELFGAVQRWPS